MNGAFQIVCSIQLQSWENFYNKETVIMKFHSNLDNADNAMETQNPDTIILALKRLLLLIFSGSVGLVGSFYSAFAGVFACTAHDFNLWYICFFTMSGPLIVFIMGVFGIILIAKKDLTSRFTKICWSMILYPILVSTITYLYIQKSS